MDKDKVLNSIKYDNFMKELGTKTLTIIKENHDTNKKLPSNND